ncbi:MAG: NAD(P)H-dependent oxidoreductase [Bacteroidota bacterium]
MKKILAFGASNSQQSINKKFVQYATSQLADVEVNLLDLNDYEMPIFSIDRQNADGIPELVQQFKAQIDAADGIVISFAEHNGAYTAAYKNIYDWVSRIDMNVWQNKPMLLLATSPGGRGAKGVLDLALRSYQFSNKNTIASFSLPAFTKNFSTETGISDESLNQTFREQLDLFAAAL